MEIFESSELKKNTALKLKYGFLICVMASVRGPIRMQTLHKKIRQILLDSSKTFVIIFKKQFGRL